MPQLGYTENINLSDIVIFYDRWWSLPARRKGVGVPLGRQTAMKVLQDKKTQDGPAFLVQQSFPKMAVTRGQSNDTMRQKDKDQEKVMALVLGY